MGFTVGLVVGYIYASRVARTKFSKARSSRGVDLTVDGRPNIGRYDTLCKIWITEIPLGGSSMYVRKIRST